MWNTASLYHLVHTAALLAAPITKHPNIVSYFVTNFKYGILTRLGLSRAGARVQGTGYRKGFVEKLHCI